MCWIRGRVESERVGRTSPVILRVELIDKKKREMGMGGTLALDGRHLMGEHTKN